MKEKISKNKRDRLEKKYKADLSEISTSNQYDSLIPGSPKNRAVSGKKTLETSLQKDFFETLIETSSQGISAFDKDLNYTAWNKTMEITTGLEKEKVLGKNMFEVIAHKAFFKELIFKVLKGQQIVLRNQQYQGREGYYDADLRPLYNKNKEIAGGIFIIQDITERIKQEEENTLVRLNQQKEIMDIILHTQEEERKRIAEGLHNGLGQLLYAMKLQLEEISRKTIEARPQKSNVKSEVESLLGNVESLLNDAIEETRTISFELMPAVLNDYGLETAIRELCTRLSIGTLKISYEFSLDKNLEYNLKNALFRIIQELVNNIMKHSHATKGHIKISSIENHIIVNVKDNGHGFDTKFLDKATGIGICSIRNRVKLVNGEFNILSSKEEGTEVIIKIQKS